MTRCIPALMLALAGCAAGPDFQRPAASSETAYTQEPLDHLSGSGDQTLAQGGSPAADWWSAFGSAPLDATIRSALHDNQNLASVQARLDQALENSNARAGSLYPQVSGSAGAGRQQFGAAFLGGFSLPPFTYYSVGPTVSYMLDYTGGNRRAVEQQRALAEYQRHELDAAYLSLSGNVALEAFQIASVRAQIDSVQTILDQDAQNAQLAQAAFDAGSGTRVDLLNAQSQLANDQTLLPGLHQQLSVARHALAILLGKSPAAWTPPDFDLASFSLPASLPLSLPSELVRQRPDILAAEAQLHAATAAVGVADASLYPQITLNASVSQQALEPGHLFNPGSTAWSLISQLSAPIFDGGTLRAQKRGAQDALRAAAASYQQTVLASFGQVADTLSALDRDAEQLAAQKRALDTSQSSVQLTRESYRTGNVGVLQVLEAERLFQQAQLGYTRAQAQRFEDTVQLYLAVGRSDIAATTLAAEDKPAQAAGLK